MELGKGLFRKTNPEKVRVLTSAKEWNRLVVFLRETRDQVVHYNIVLKSVFEKSEDVEAILTVLGKVTEL
jgi:hypothetical protein